MKWFTQKLKGYRTIIINILLSVMPVMELTELTQVMPQEWLPWYALGMALVNMWLRSVTTTRIGHRE
jgi:hypothetical protein